MMKTLIFTYLRGHLGNGIYGSYSQKVASNELPIKACTSKSQQIPLFT